MAIAYKSPGVYVEEVERGVKPIEAVGTSTAAFIGITSEASLKAIDAKTGERIVLESRLNKPTLVTSWTQYCDIFGEFSPGIFLPDAVYGYFANGGSACYITSLRALKESPGAGGIAEVSIPAKNKGASFKLTAKIPGPAGNDLVAIIRAEGEDAFGLTVRGETLSGLSMKKGENYIGEASLTSATISGVGPASALPAEGSYPFSGGGFQALTPDEIIGDPTDRTGLGGLEAQDNIRLVLCPDLMAGFDGSTQARERVKLVQTAIKDHCQAMKYRFAILDAPPDLTAQQASEWQNYINLDTSYAALYYPWIRVADLSGSGATTRLVPPSGHIAGIYNRSDAERGVHKAPANEVVQNAVGVELNLSRGEQDVLNPIGVNCIRAFPGRGIRVWGGRTLSSNGAWRYVNVRRLFIMVEASMDAGLQWVVFEPNDSTLWAKVRRDVTSFLRVVWRSGALFGDTPEQAFYVKCDEELNPPEIRDLGQLVIEVGLAPVKPAEFVIFRITQWAGVNAEA